MNLNRYCGGTVGILALAALACGCSSKSNDCKANLSCTPFDGSSAGNGANTSAGTSGLGGQSGTSGEGNASGRPGSSGDGGTSSGDAGAGGGPAKCNGTLSPDADSCVISDDFGVFVSPDGDDTTGDGSEATPFATLTMALANLGSSKRVYVCDGDYSEPGTLEIPSGASIFGGFGCDSGHWIYDSANNHARFTPNSPIGADVKNATGVVLQDLSITAQDATSPGASSFGLMVVNGGAVLTRVEVKAGKGAAGTAGVDGTKGADGAVTGTDQQGQTAVCGGAGGMSKGGAWATVSDCGVLGGHGGAGYVSSAETGGVGTPSINVSPSDVQNGGAGESATDSAKSGGDGSKGNYGETGMLAAPTGTFSESGYANASGGDGTSGYPGQGGGGGGASKGNGTTCSGASGGAGGMGGCGGTLGSGGKGGGASVALLSWNSTVKLMKSSLVANSGGAGGNGGKGGAGGLGRQGAAGGDADALHAISGGKNGGQGGLGGNGGNGAGGSGGPSIGIVYSTTAPVVDDMSTVTPGTGGALGVGGDYGTPATKAPDGTAGLAVAKYLIP